MMLVTMYRLASCSSLLLHSSRSRSLIAQRGTESSASNRSNSHARRPTPDSTMSHDGRIRRLAYD